MWFSQEEEEEEEEASGQRMHGSILPLPQYVFMAWCSVKAQGQLYLYLNVYSKYEVLNSTRTM
jgi:hypothetical protein